MASRDWGSNTHGGKNFIIGFVTILKSLENKTTINFVNESYLFTHISSIVKTYTTNGARIVYICFRWSKKEISLGEPTFLKKVFFFLTKGSCINNYIFIVTVYILFLMIVVYNQ